MKRDRVSWRIALVIWWARYWRYWAVAVGLLTIANLLGFNALVAFIHAGAVQRWIGWGVRFAIGVAIDIWSEREALVNRYKNFALKITEHHKAGEEETVMPSDARVNWRIAAAVWWAGCWRCWLAMLPVMAGAAALLIHLQRIHSPLVSSMLVLTIPVLLAMLSIPFQVWAVRESLVNDYPSFDLKITSPAPRLAA